MIILPTRQKLIRRRDALYEKLDSIVNCASVHQVEDILRRIHSINLKLRTYFVKEHEPKELFEDEDTVEKKNPFETQESV